MLELVVAYQPVQAQSCTVDPLGSEVCLPDSTPEEPDQSDKPKKSNQSNKPKQTVIVPQCFGPYTQFPQLLPTASSRRRSLRRLLQTPRRYQ